MTTLAKRVGHCRRHALMVKSPIITARPPPNSVKQLVDTQHRTRRARPPQIIGRNTETVTLAL
eukprot:13037828-Alexandrium_andersonii.AAC.1